MNSTFRSATRRSAYVATIVGRTDPAPVPEYDLSMYLRPSRYAEADKFYGFAATGVRRLRSYADAQTVRSISRGLGAITAAGRRSGLSPVDDYP